MSGCLASGGKSVEPKVELSWLELTTLSGSLATELSRLIYLKDLRSLPLPFSIFLLCQSSRPLRLVLTPRGIS